MLGPAGMMIEMTRDERDIDVAGFADRLAIVQRFKDSKQPAFLLDLARDGIEIFGALEPGQLRPARKGGAGGFDGLFHFGFARLGDVGQLFAIGRIVRGKCFARLGETAIDEMAELFSVRSQPIEGRASGFGSRTVFEGFKDFRHFGHFVSPGVGPLGSCKLGVLFQTGLPNAPVSGETHTGPRE